MGGGQLSAEEDRRGDPMTLRRLMGEAGGALSRRRFLAGSGAAGWCAACAASSGRQGAAPGNNAAPGTVASGAAGTSGTPSEPITIPIGAESYSLAEDPRLVVKFYRCNPVHALPPQLMVPAAGARRRPEEPVVCRGDSVGPPAPPPPAHVEAIWREARGIIRRLRDLENPQAPGRPLFPDPYPLAEDGTGRGRAPLEIILLDLSVWGFRGGTHPDEPQILIQNSLAVDESRAVLAHEIFHRIQYKFNNVDWRPWLFRDVEEIGFDGRGSIMEGGARAAEAVLAAGADRYLHDGRAWFDGSAQTLFMRSLPARGRPNTNLYATGLFWKYVAEQHGRTRHGLETQHALLSHVASTAVPDDPDPPAFVFDPRQVRLARGAMAGPGHFDTMLADREGGFLATETTWGSFLAALVLNHAPSLDSRFRFRDAEIWKGGASPQVTIAPERVLVFEALPVSLDGLHQDEFSPAEIQDRQRPSFEDRAREWFRPWLAPGSAGDLRRWPIAGLDPYAFTCWRIDFRDDAPAPILRVRLRGRGGVRAFLLQVILIDRAGQLLDIDRSEPDAAGEADRLIAARGAATAYVMVASRDQAGDVRIGFSRAVNTPLLSATNWNAGFAKRLSVDPARSVWSWRSPDLFLHGNRHTLLVRVSNDGSARAEDVVVALAWKRADAGFHAAPWTVLTDPPTGPGIPPPPKDAPVRVARPFATNGQGTDPAGGYAIETIDECFAQQNYRDHLPGGGRASCRNTHRPNEEVFHFRWPDALRAMDDVVVRAGFRCRNPMRAGMEYIFSCVGRRTPPRASSEYVP